MTPIATVGIIAATVVVAIGAPTRGQDRSDAIYAAGTDSAMRYLAEHGGDLRTTLILQECGLSSLASRAAEKLPNSVAWFAGSNEALAVSSDEVLLAGQVTRGYLLGFETGVRLEFHRFPDEWKLASCNLAASALGGP
jgi:hypothetical protein